MYVAVFGLCRSKPKHGHCGQRPSGFLSLRTSPDAKGKPDNKEKAPKRNDGVMAGVVPRVLVQWGFLALA